MYESNKAVYALWGRDPVRSVVVSGLIIEVLPKRDDKVWVERPLRRSNLTEDVKESATMNVVQAILQEALVESAKAH